MTKFLEHDPFRSSGHPVIRSSPYGFTLLEMSIVLVIISIVSIGLVEIFAASIQKAQLKQTVAKMESIQKTLYEYRLAFNRLPCPADATIAINVVNFGIEAANPGSCTGGIPAANFLQSPGGTAQDAREGMVPTKTLGLPDDYAFDGWGRRFMYAVSKDITQNGAFAAIPASDSATRMTIMSAQGVSKSTQAVEVLVSFGQNGHGAYPRNGGTVRVNAGLSNTDEQNNCDCTIISNVITPTGLDGVFVQKDLSNGFDDIVYFSVRGDYLRPSGIMSQPFTTDVGTNGNGMCQGGGMPSCKVTNGVRNCQCAF